MASIQARSSIIRFAESRDLSRIQAINRSWIQIGESERADKSFGYLFGAPYDRSDLDILCGEGAISIAEVNGEIAGYFLFDDWTTNATTESYRRSIDAENLRHLLPSGPVCIRSQVAILQEYQSLGIYRPLQDHLCDSMADRFEAVFSHVAKSNAKSHIHERYGFQTIAENDALFFVLKRLRARLA